MKVEQSQVTKLEITNVEKHDPIRVYLEDDNQGHGRLTITEWGEAWTAYWPAMSCSLIDFIIRADNGYLISYLSSKPLGVRSVAYKRLDSRLNAVREALKQISVN
ncbi:hypothetical protein [Proteus sp. TSJ240517]|uniref:hypothetical protein n=1 Tax=Proteus sp. TSJ240517 TaxID=3399622 RepID=UPI003A4E0004